jgi:hypothetical protein
MARIFVGMISVVRNNLFIVVQGRAIDKSDGQRLLSKTVVSWR